MLQLLLAVSIGHEPVVADAVESTGEHVEQESPDEVLGGERHDLLLIVISIVSPVETDLPVFHTHDPMVGNRHPVRVAPDVFHHLLGSGEGRLGVDDPFDFANTMEVLPENLGISKGLQ